MPEPELPLVTPTGSDSGGTSGGGPAPDPELLASLQAALAPTFTIVRHLGAGGMGSVFLARDAALRRLVAVKALSPATSRDETDRHRFQREAQAVAAIAHPNVVAVYSVGETATGVPYFVMQYVSGRTMAERLREEGPLDIDAATRVLGEVASALAAAHKQGIIHRDIKPSNILWDDGSGRAMVSDFGIAAVLERAEEKEATKITHTGMLMGTPAYMSPEQILAEKVTDKTDIYSLGLLGYELLTGAGPYEISSPREIMAAHLRDVPKKLSTVRPDIHPELEALLAACLTKDPAARPTADEVGRRLAQGASVMLEWPPPGLDELHGRLGLALGLLPAGSYALIVPLLLMSVFDRDGSARLLMPPTLVIASMTAVGAVLFIAGTIVLWRRLRAATRAVGAGYRWGTVAEVLADSRRDTGALIAGAREYAALTPDQRNTLRVRRLVVAGLRLAGSVLPLIGYLGTVLLTASMSWGPAAVLDVSFVLPMMLFVLAELLTWNERRQLRDARKRLRARRHGAEGLGRLSSGWTESFEQVRQGQRMGAGRRGGRRLLVAGAALLVAVCVGAGMVGYALSAYGVAAREIFSMSRLNFANAEQKYHRLARLRRWRLPVDTALTPLAAGEILHAIGWWVPPKNPSPLERPPAHPIMAMTWHDVPEEKGLFAGGKPDPAWPLRAMQQATRGFSAEERAYLVRHSSRVEPSGFRTLARAGRVDEFGARLRWPIPESTIYAMLPIMRYAKLKEMANANVAAAALDLADRRLDRAERRLREVISVGFLLIDDGTLLIDNLVGVVIVGNGRDGLVRLLEATGRDAEARDLAADADPVASGDAMVLAKARLTFDDQIREMRAILADTTRLRGLRWETVNVAAFEPCADLRELLFGPDSAHVATMAAARRTLVRRTSDSALFAIVETALERPWWADGWPRPLPVRALRGAMRGISYLTGTRRIETCVSSIQGEK